MKKPSMLEGLLAQKPKRDETPLAGDGDVAGEGAAASDAERMRVVVRLNVEAIEGLEAICREQRRLTGRPVPMQRLLEEAVEDVLRKHGQPATVLPAPTKRGR